jgi:hypothetical protein
VADSFAGTDDYATRTGQTLTTAEAAQVAVLLGEASEMIREASPGIDDRMAAGSPAPTLVTGICVRMVFRYLANPKQSASDTTGPFTSSWAGANTRGLVLTEDDLAILNRTIGQIATPRGVATIRVGVPVGTARNGPYRWGCGPWR